MVGSYSSAGSRWQIAAAVSLYPVLLPSSRNVAQHITISNSLARHHDLAVGLVWWGFGILLAIGYFEFVYRMFRGKVAEVAEAHADRTTIKPRLKCEPDVNLCAARRTRRSGTLIYPWCIAD